MTKLPKLHLPHITPHTWAYVAKILAVAGALFIVFMLFKLNASSNQLALQAKAIAEQNQRIAKANGRHIDCIADLFAKYTQDKLPISKVDLNKCQITESEAQAILNGTFPVSSGSSSGAVDFLPNTDNPNAGAKPANNPPNQSNNDKPPAEQPSFIRDFVDTVHNVTDPIPLVNKVL